MTEQDIVNSLQEMMEKELLSRPMWLRLNYLCNQINALLNDGHTEADINWEKINEILTTNVNEYDFNFFKRIENFNQLLSIAGDCRCGPLDGIWQSHICKDCGEEFFMDYDEVHFYEKKGLYIPKRCKACRYKRKVNK